MATERDLVLRVAARGLSSLTLTPSGDPVFLKGGELVMTIKGARNPEWPALFKEGDQYRVRFERVEG